MAKVLTITGTPGAGVAQPAACRSAAGQDVVVPTLPSDPAGQAPRHCGTPMRWTAPVLGARTDYSFDAGTDSAPLPPVWRCSCGFQLDGIVHTRHSLAALS